MSEYTADTPAGLSLEELERAVAGEEAAGAIFLDGKVTYTNGKMVNLLKFVDLPPGQRPKDRIIFVRYGDNKPAGKKLIWEGVLLVLGGATPLWAFR